MRYLKSTSLVLFLCLVTVSFVSCEQASVGSGGSVRNAGDSDRELPVLVELGSVTCIPCQKMVPVLEKLREEYQGRLRVESYDVRESPKMGRVFGVTTIPTQVFLDDEGKEIYRHVGYLPYEEIVKTLAGMGI